MASYQRMRPIHHNLLRRLWLFGFVLSMLLSQTLGQLHSVKHGYKHDDSVVAAHSPQDSHQEHGFLDQLFSQHSGDADCRLYDQLADSHALPFALPVTLPIVLPSFSVASFAGDALARWAALFDARGPPLTV